MIKKLDLNIVRTKKNILLSHSAYINSKEYHSYDYDKKIESLNCNTIEYKNKENSNLHYGIIRNLFSIDDKGYCCVQKFFKDDNNYFFRNLHNLVYKHIDKFFILVSLTDEYELVEWNLITRRCILTEYFLENKKEIILSPCNDLSEY